MKKFFSNKPRAWFIIGSVLIVLITALALGINYFYKQDSDVLAVVDGEEITQTDLDAKIQSENYGLGIDPATLTTEENKKYLNEIIEEKILDKEITKNEITISDEELTATAIERNTTFETLSSEYKEISLAALRYEAAKNEISETQTNWKAGRYLLVRFDLYNYDTTEQDLSTKISEHKTYADEVAQEIATGLKNGTLTYEAAVKKVYNDPILGHVPYEKLRVDYFGDYTKENYQNKESYFSSSYAGFTKATAETALNTYSSPYLVSGDKELAYAIVQNTSEGNINGAADYASWLESKKVEYNVKIISNKYASAKPLAGVALAAPTGTGYSCNPSGTENTAPIVYTRYLDNNLVLQNYENVVIQESAGSTTSPSLVDKYSGCTQSATGAYRIGNSNDRTDAVGKWYLNVGHYNGTTPIDYAHFIKCADSGNIQGTSATTIFLSKSTPAITGTDTATGKWKYYGVSGNVTVLDGLVKDSALLNDPTNSTAYNRVGITLNKVVNGITSWANGTTPTVSVYWDPNYKPVTTLVSPANNTTFTLPAGQTTMNVPVTVRAFDGDSDNVRIAIYKNGVVSGYNPNTTQFSPDNTDRTYTFSGLPAGTYTWKANASDSKAWGNDSTTWTFIVAPGATTSTEACICGLDTNTPDDPNCIAPTTGVTHDQALCAIPDNTAALTCSVTPQNGLAPLVVSVTASGGTPPYDFIMGDGTTLTDRTSPVYYTFGSAGPKSIIVRDAANPTPANCPASVTVTDPTDTGGGEVTP